jgi:hypothetical protein
MLWFAQLLVWHLLCAQRTIFPDPSSTLDVAVDHGIFGELTFLKGIEVRTCRVKSICARDSCRQHYNARTWPGDGGGGADGS